MLLQISFKSLNLFSEFNLKSYITRAVSQWLRHCATNRKVAGSNPDGVIGIFHWHNPSGRTMALRSTQPLTDMSTRNISWGKGGRCVGLTTLPPSCADCLKSGSLGLLEPLGPVKACNRVALPVLYYERYRCYAHSTNWVLLRLL
jgi:hypothetical protein